MSDIDVMRLISLSPVRNRIAMAFAMLLHSWHSQYRLSVVKEAPLSALREYGARENESA
jgi:hypothetical protein